MLTWHADAPNSESARVTSTCCRTIDEERPGCFKHTSGTESKIDERNLLTMHPGRQVIVVCRNAADEHQSGASSRNLPLVASWVSDCYDVLTAIYVYLYVCRSRDVQMLCMMSNDRCKHHLTNNIIRWCTYVVRNSSADSN